MLQNYYGFVFIKHDKGTIEMKQEFLFKRVITTLGFNNNHMNASISPVVKLILHKDESGPPYKHE